MKKSKCSVSQQGKLEILPSLLTKLDSKIQIPKSVSASLKMALNDQKSIPVFYKLNKTTDTLFSRVVND